MHVCIFIPENTENIKQLAETMLPLGYKCYLNIIQERESVNNSGNIIERHCSL